MRKFFTTETGDLDSFRLVAVGTGIFGLGAVSGALVARNVGKRGVAESYFSDIAEEAGLTGFSAETFCNVSEGQIKAQAAKAKLPVQPAPIAQPAPVQPVAQPALPATDESMAKLDRYLERMMDLAAKSMQPIQPAQKRTTHKVRTVVAKKATKVPMVHAAGNNRGNNRGGGNNKA